jgi:glycosyltransferase involved in cell wall biosynthesis
LKPLVSVVVATYNASHLLRHAIGSVRLQDLEDWELVVVGDHCTDDSEAVVASFRDERIRFLNLPRNSGQQATPNNVGVREARGEYLAFLNQDDLYLPDHLSASLASLRSTDADLVCTPCAEVLPEQAGKIASREIVARAHGFETSGRFSPRTFHVASTWFLRRATALEFGPWRMENDTYVLPSQEWLFRAWRRGARIHCADHITVAVLYSGARRDSYRKRQSPEHDFVFAEVIASDRLRGALQSAARKYIDDQIQLRRRLRRRRLRNLTNVRYFRRHLSEGLRSLSEAIAIQLGIHPHSLSNRWRYGSRGGLIAELKKFTG